jgi:hypothetical protein
MAFVLSPVTLSEANAFVAAHHRHHKPARGCRFALGLWDDGRLCAVAIVGRPSARHLDEREIAEVTRLCTDGTANAYSKLYSACRRVWFAMGGKRLVTYILSEELGSSLRASGWELMATTRAQSWDRPSRFTHEPEPGAEAKMGEAHINAILSPTLG